MVHVYLCLTYSHVFSGYTTNQGDCNTDEADIQGEILYRLNAVEEHLADKQFQGMIIQGNKDAKSPVINGIEERLKRVETLVTEEKIKEMVRTSVEAIPREYVVSQVRIDGGVEEMLQRADSNVNVINIGEDEKSNNREDKNANDSATASASDDVRMVYIGGEFDNSWQEDRAIETSKAIPHPPIAFAHQTPEKTAQEMPEIAVSTPVQSSYPRELLLRHVSPFSLPTSSQTIHTKAKSICGDVVAKKSPHLKTLSEYGDVTGEEEQMSDMETDSILEMLNSQVTLKVTYVFIVHHLCN